MSQLTLDIPEEQDEPLEGQMRFTECLSKCEVYLRGKWRDISIVYRWQRIRHRNK